MKALAIAVGIVIVMMVALQFKSDTVSYVNESTLEVQTVEVKPDWSVDEEAVKAAQDVIKRKQLEADLKAKDEEILKAEEALKELKTERKALTTELTAYWGDTSRIKRLIRDTFPEDPVTAVAVAMAESGDGHVFNPYALNSKDSHKGCSGSYGIFQIGCLHEGDPTKLYDIEYNIQKARELYDDSGWQPWGAYTDGRYKQYLAYNR